MKEIVPKRDIWPSYGTKSATADCKQAVNDDESCQSFALFFSQHLHKLFGNIDAITYLKPPDFTNRQILTLIRDYGKETFLQIESYHWHISSGRSTYVRYMRQLCKCSYVVTATFLDHDKVQKTDLKPLQPVWSVSTKCLRIDSTKYSCVQFDVQFSTSVVNKLHCTFAWICVDFSWKTAF